MAVDLYSYQIEAIEKLKTGSILCGGVGSGKSRTALAYYLLLDCKGELKVRERYDEDILPFSSWKCFKPMEHPRDLYVITTAKKRDSKEWEGELAHFCLCEDEEAGANAYGVKVSIDSWNNIKKYKDVYGAFFIFDEQRVVGNGVWVKAFLNIARKNHWILLSATPGDSWSDYIPVFVANGFYKNKTEFNQRHCVFSRFSKYPKIERYVGEKELQRNLDKILVKMEDHRMTERREIPIIVEYDKEKYRRVWRDRWNIYDDEPIEESGKLLYLIRKVVNSDLSRIKKIEEIWLEKGRCIIFYNFNYELDMLRNWCEKWGIAYDEWNGQRHGTIPDAKRWVYLVQYSAGCEGWNCISCDTIIFYSQNYSYRITEQAAGRIDRINTPYHTLYYYYLRSNAPIDLAIYGALRNKRNFNERSFMKKNGKEK